jgi:arylsulfatase A-like enzyme
MPGVAPRAPGEYLTDRLAEEAAEFIRRNRDRPFFLYLSHYAPHTRLAGKPDKVAKYRARPGAGKDRNHPELAAMIESLDESVGRVLSTLDELKLAERTVVLFTSDNGGESNVTSNAPLRAGKSHLYEGGVRVPLLVRWPGEVRPGSTCDAPVSSVDVSPTLADLARADFDAPDGESLVALLTSSGALRREALFWHYPRARPHFLGGRSSGAVLRGDFKLIEFFDTGAVELYNLREDEGEGRDLSASHPERVAALRRELEEWRRRVDARTPRK